jgi:hypothetical protein
MLSENPVSACLLVPFFNCPFLGIGHNGRLFYVVSKWFKAPHTRQPTLQPVGGQQGFAFPLGKSLVTKIHKSLCGCQARWGLTA